jgi:hypothetical protein
MAKGTDFVEKIATCCRTSRTVYPTSFQILSSNSTQNGSTAHTMSFMDPWRNREEIKSKDIHIFNALGHSVD